MDIAERYDLLVIEDAAQGVMSTYKGSALGSIGHLGTYSFHETKNIISGEGGALLINDPLGQCSLLDRLLRQRVRHLLHGFDGLKALSERRLLSLLAIRPIYSQRFVLRRNDVLIDFLYRLIHYKWASDVVLGLLQAAFSVV